LLSFPSGFNPLFPLKFTRAGHGKTVSAFDTILGMSSLPWIKLYPLILSDPKLFGLSDV
jgi:hypothetical protein